METDLLDHHQLLISMALYGSLAMVILWESFAELRPSENSPLIRWSNNIAIWFIGVFLERWLLAALGLTAALYAQNRQWGVAHIVQLPEPIVIVLSVFLLDFLFYIAHRIWHHIPVLWRFHRIHHSDTEFDFSIAFRRHPVEPLLNGITLVPIVILLGVSPVAVLIFQVIRAVVLMFEHTNVGIPEGADRFLRYLIVTPNMHRVHHSSLKEETDSNFSDLFPVWDRLFGTYREHPKQSQEKMEIGLEYFRDPEEVWVHRLLMQPFQPLTNIRRGDATG